jgi:hypothetical protein
MLMALFLTNPKKPDIFLLKRFRIYGCPMWKRHENCGIWEVKEFLTNWSIGGFS